MKRTFVLAAMACCLVPCLMAQEMTTKSVELPPLFGQGDIRDIIKELPTQDGRFKALPQQRAEGMAGYSYQDRIIDMPDYLHEFTDRYVTAMKEVLAGGKNWLSDPSLGDGVDQNGYYVEIKTFTDEVPFSFTPGNQAECEMKAGAVMSQAAQEVYSTFQAYMPYAFTCMTNDHPEAFWLQHTNFNYSAGQGYSYGYNLAQGQGTVRWSVNLRYYLLMPNGFDVRARSLQNFNNPSFLANSIKQFNDAVENVLASCTAASRFDTLLNLHDWLTRNNVYNAYFLMGYTQSNIGDMPWSPYSGLVAHSGQEAPVCEGYARAMKVICDRLGIPCVLVYGDAKQSYEGLAGPHMWCYVQMEDGQWYADDPTWDDPAVQGLNSVTSGYEGHDWFLLGSQTEVSTGLSFLMSHPETSFLSNGIWNLVPGPVLSEKRYVLNIPIEAVALESDSLSVVKGEELTIAYTLTPSGTTEGEVTWTTSDEIIASVDPESGCITGQHVGQAMIYITSQANPELSDSCIVTVIPTEEVQLALDSLVTLIGEAQTAYDESTEGTEDGQYEEGAREALLEALTAVSSQASGDLTVEALEALQEEMREALDAFAEKVVDNSLKPATDLTDIAYTVYVPDSKAFRGQEFTLHINLKNAAENVTGFQCDLKLPAGVTLARNDRGKIKAPVFNEKADRTSSEYHTVTATEQENGLIHIHCFSPDDEVILGLDGIVCDLTATIAEDMEPADYNIVLSNVIVTTEAGDETQSRIYAVLTVPTFTIGDVNGDTAVTDDDMAATASHILGTTPALFVDKAADVNKDEEINVTDLAGIAAIMHPESVPTEEPVAKSEQPQLEVVPFAVASGSTDINAKLDLNGEVKNEFIAFQCDVVLPEGITWKLNRRGDKLNAPAFNAEADRTSLEYHTAAAAQMEDGSVRIICYSTENEFILGNEGTVLDLPLVLAEGLTDSIYNITLQNIVLTHSDLTQTKLDAYAFSLIVGKPALAAAAIQGHITASAIASIGEAFAENADLTSLDLTAATTIDAEAPIATANPNLLIYVKEETAVANTQNVVAGSACTELVLSDAYPFSAPTSFTAASASYTRTTDTEWGTVCLPYVLKSDETIQYYEVTYIDEEAGLVTLWPINEVAAGYPAVYSQQQGTSVTFASTEVDVATEGAGSWETTIDEKPWTMKGSFGPLHIEASDAAIYQLEQDQLRRASMPVSIGSFSAWFETEKRSIKTYDLSLDGTTGIKDLKHADGSVTVSFDLLGRKQSRLQPGQVNIIGGKKVLAPVAR